MMYDKEILHALEELVVNKEWVDIDIPTQEEIYIVLEYLKTKINEK